MPSRRSACRRSSGPAPTSRIAQPSRSPAGGRGDRGCHRPLPGASVFQGGGPPSRELPRAGASRPRSAAAGRGEVSHLGGVRMRFRRSVAPEPTVQGVPWSHPGRVPGAVPGAAALPRRGGLDRGMRCCWRRKCEIDPRSRRSSASRSDQEPAPRSQRHDWLDVSVDVHRSGGRSGRGRTVLPVAPTHFGGGNQPNGPSGWCPAITDSAGGETSRRAARERRGLKSA